MDGSGITLADRCTGRWGSILPALGIRKDYLTGKNGPCPICEGKDRWRYINRRGAGEWWCNNCGHGSGIDLVKLWLKTDFAGAAREVEKLIESSVATPIRKHDPVTQRNWMRDVWGMARDLREDGPDGRYLVSRGLRLAKYPKSLRFFDHVPYDRTRHAPAVLGLVRDAAGRAVNVHRIFLTPEGEKTDWVPARKLMWGPCPPGSAIRLFPAYEILGIAEGIETALAAAQLYKLPV